MERSDQSALQHLGLPTACAVIFSKVNGKTLDARDPAEMQLVLNEVAKAISNLVAIFAVDPEKNLPRTLTAFELLDGKFIHGAHAFKGPGGEILRELTIQRRDMLRVIDMLRAVQIRFREPR